MAILPGSLIRSASNLWLVSFSLSYDLAAQELGHQSSHQRDRCSSALKSFATYFQAFNLHHQNELEKEFQAHPVSASAWNMQLNVHFCSVWGLCIPLWVGNLRLGSGFAV